MAYLRNGRLRPSPQGATYRRSDGTVWDREQMTPLCPPTTHHLFPSLSSSYTMPQALPFDVISRILDLLPDEHPTLRSFSLTNRAIHPYARALLFRKISLTSGDRTYWLFSELLAKCAKIGPLVQHLAIRDLEPSILPENPMFSRLLNLHTLDLHSVAFRSTYALCILLASMPCLTTLTCTRVILRPPSSSIPPPSTVPHMGIPPQLKTVIMTQMPSAISSRSHSEIALPNQLATWISTTSDCVQSLHTVDLDFSVPEAYRA